MKLHEYQSKSYFSREEIPIPKSGLATTPSEAKQIASEIGYPVVLKAQVLVGGRGKAGGIRLVKNEEEAELISTQILNSRIKGISVKKILVEKAVSIQQEFYLGITYDRGIARPILILSGAGGIDIEEVAQNIPELIAKTSINPLLGLQNFAIRSLASSLGLDYSLWKPLQHISQALWSLYNKLDATLVEINPLVAASDQHLIALDAKITIDDNALYRQRELMEMADQTVEFPEELEAKKFGLNYIHLEGSIGCMVNGAGLAMATMDCVQQAGSEPANFLDIGGGATAEKVSSALQITLSDPKVKALLINIFGGITRCDEVANGIISALPYNKNNLPIVVRLEGTNAEQGRAILQACPDLIVAETLMEAATLSVKAIESITL